MSLFIKKPLDHVLAQAADNDKSVKIDKIVSYPYGAPP